MRNEVCPQSHRQGPAPLLAVSRWTLLRVGERNDCLMHKGVTIAIIPSMVQRCKTWKEKVFFVQNHPYPVFLFLSLKCWALTCAGSHEERGSARTEVGNKWPAKYE